jgi:hypothetical protein
VAGGRLERHPLETLARLRRERHDEAALTAAVDLLVATATGRAA